MGWQKQSLLKTGLLGILALGALMPSSLWAANSKKKIFILSSTYGVLTGTLAGIASLAFYDQPGKHGRNVAVGASLGLYAGILLGGFIVYSTPDPKKDKAKQEVQEKKQEEQEKKQEQQFEENPLNLEPQRTEVPRLIPLIYADQKGRANLGLRYLF